ncbi:MAG TPA: glycerophosphodiester phosphodiesterase [Acidimicrobiia bacterium]|nr:glycerophosphodiester phosphodiesterase [Acidimicrobiia bacterium]
MSSIFHASSPLGIAHRGSRLLWPENTLTAFSGAAATGFEHFETDVRVTADGVLVCFHDADLSRTTDGRGPISATRWEAVARLDAGHRHRLHEQFPFRGLNVEVPRFQDLARAFPHAGLVVDLKADASVEPLASAIEALGATGRVIVGSFSGTRLNHFRSITEGAVATSAGPRETIKAILGGAGGRLLDTPPQAFQVPVSWYGIPVITERFVKAVHLAGKLVHAWTVNRPQEMRNLLDLGVDGLITDRPDLLAPLLGRKA